jgi:hypothetical protein
MSPQRLASRARWARDRSSSPGPPRSACSNCRWVIPIVRCTWSCATPAFFEAAGAEPWAREQARGRLGAAGGRLGADRRPFPTRSDAAELQVALVVAKGATNKEAAAARCVSPKTVEFQLANVYLQARPPLSRAARPRCRGDLTSRRGGKDRAASLFASAAPPDPEAVEGVNGTGSIPRTLPLTVAGSYELSPNVA